MASAIDPTKPPHGNALTADVRTNFQSAKDEIEALQAIPSLLLESGAVQVAVSDLPAAGALDGTELVPIVQGGVTVQTTIGDLSTPNTSGTYTPTSSSAVNVADSTRYVSQWERVDNGPDPGWLIVIGKVDITPTAGATPTSYGLGLPGTANFGNEQEAVGSAISIDGTSAVVHADLDTGNTVIIEFVSATTDPVTLFYNFSYLEAGGA